MKFNLLALASLLLIGLTLIGCSNSSDDQAPSDLDQFQSVGPEAAQENRGWPDGQTLRDNQGAVDVQVTPLNLNNPDDTLTFNVSMDTHSIDLSMNLVDLASLQTNTGLIVRASSWDAPLGGHHVSGILSFPSMINDTQILEDAIEVELVITNLDVPERIFSWER